MSDCLLRTPAPDAILHRPINHAEPLCPLSNRVGFSIECDGLGSLVMNHVPAVDNVLPNGTGQCLIDTQPVDEQARPDKVFAQTEFVAPFLHRLASSLVFKYHIAAAVILLLLREYPTAILRGVVAVAVDAVKLVFTRRGLTHVFKEQPERRKPAVAYLYSATVIVFFLRVFAPRFHCCVSPVKWMFGG